MRISDWSSDVCSSDLGFPAIEVAACATNVDLAVDRTAATQQLAGRPQKSAAVDRRVRLLAIAPVVSRMADQSREADRQLHQHGFGFAARLDQRNRDAGIFAEAGGEDRPQIGRASWRGRVCQYV